MLSSANQIGQKRKTLIVSKLWLLLAFSFWVIPFQEVPLNALGIQSTAGEFNPILAPIYLVILIFYWLGRRKKYDIKHLSWLLTIIIFISLINLDFNVKLVRDFIYLSIFFLLTNIISDNYDGAYSELIIKRIITGFLIIQLLIPILFFPIMYDGDRLTLNSLSDTNSALTLFLVASSYCSLKLRFYKPIFFAVVILIILSGSRAAFLIQFIFFILFMDRFISDKRLRYFIVMAFGSLIGVIIVFILPLIIEVVSEFRVFSVADAEEGSIASRLNWYMIMINELIQRPIGGNGAGYAEFLVGKIVHNDLLRFWIDYSVVFLGVFLISYISIGRKYSNTNARSLFKYIRQKLRSILMLGFSLVALSLYNGFQDLILVISYSLFNASLFTTQRK